MMRTATAVLSSKLAACTVLFVLISAPAAFAAKVCPAGPTVSGVDVSHYQGIVEWGQVQASGRAFAFAYVSSGLLPDPTFSVNYAAIKAAGMIRGAIQFFQPSQDPIAQANLVLANIGTSGPGDLPPALDVEVAEGLSPALLAGAIQTWISTVQLAIGRVPIIYSSANFWNAN